MRFHAMLATLFTFTVSLTAEPDYQQLLVTIEPFGMSVFGQTEELKLEPNGRCSYKVGPREARQNVAARAGGFFRRQLPDDRIERLNALLKDTGVRPARP